MNATYHNERAYNPVCLKFCLLSNPHAITLFAVRVSMENYTAQPWNHLSPIDSSPKPYVNIAGYRTP